MKKATVLLLAIVLAFGLLSCNQGDDDPSTSSGQTDDDDDDDLSCDDDTCIDPVSGLMWQNSREKNLHWREAISYCENLDLGGFNDWRLPTASELRTLIRGCESTEPGGLCKMTDSCQALFDCYDSVACQCEYLDGPNNDCYGPFEMKGECDSFWSSSLLTRPNSGISYCFICVTFSFAGVHCKVPLTNDSSARCVR